MAANASAMSPRAMPNLASSCPVATCAWVSMTMPGFTATSVYAKLWDASGLPYPALVDRLVAIAVERFADERRHRF